MRPLRDIDSVERSMAIRIAVLAGMPVLFLLVVVERVGFVGSHVSVWWLIIVDLAIATVIVVLLWGFVRQAGAVTNSLLMPSGTQPVREYSEADTLIARGEFAEAVNFYRSFIVAFPEDLDARLRLGALLAGPCADPAAAERCFLETRAMVPSPDQERVVGNALIDLYRSAGRRPELKAELARFARLNHPTRAGALARRHLQRLTREDAAGDADQP